MIDSNLAEQYQGKKVLVTGGTGLIGRQVVKLLCDFGAEVCVASLDEITVDSRAEHRFCDLTSLENC
ncbi:MAG: NAD-dependent epimerase/dehydratase family protein, partial [Pseudomonadota bacterium]|nr:NAD-dependent epimerase/dehydratase family protein [Pseudomonadota bacterium]